MLVSKLMNTKELYSPYDVSYVNPDTFNANTSDYNKKHTFKLASQNQRLGLRKR